VTYEGKIYNTLLIGSQCWLKENLDVGTHIWVPQTNNQIIEKFCYDANIANCNIYGGLYEWGEMMQYVTTSGTQGICPSGWHIPTDTEFSVLCTYLGGDTIAGGKLKEAGTVHWLPPNTGATNESGFTALPGGYGRYIAGLMGFANLTAYAYIWTSSQNGNEAWSQRLYFNQKTFHKGSNNVTWGFSVRCIKD
jgi:uncharacterized protein (TIGR02145 family)